MITVNKLRIENDNLIIDVEIDTSLCEISDPCTIDHIDIYNQDNYNSSTPSLSIPVAATEYSDTIPLNTSAYNLKSTDFILVKVCWDGTPTSDCPCGQDESPENFAVYDMGLIYQKGIQYMRGLTNCCADKNNAINFILTQKYFDLCLVNGALVEAIDLWNKMMNNTSTPATNNCGCHA